MKLIYSDPCPLIIGRCIDNVDNADLFALDRALQIKKSFLQKLVIMLYHHHLLYYFFLVHPKIIQQ